MANMNHVTLAGNLTRDPEFAYTSNSGTAIARMTLAVSRRTKGETDFIPVKAIGKLAELAKTYLHAGSGILVSGRLQSYTFEKKGIKQYGLELVISEMQFLSRADGVAELDEQAA